MPRSLFSWAAGPWDLEMNLWVPEKYRSFQCEHSDVGFLRGVYEIERPLVRAQRNPGEDGVGRRAEHLAGLPRQRVDRPDRVVAQEQQGAAVAQPGRVGPGLGQHLDAPVGERVEDDPPLLVETGAPAPARRPAGPPQP